MIADNTQAEAGGHANLGARVEAEFDVSAGRFYAFAVSFDDIDPAKSAAIAEIRFLNSAGQQLRGPYAGASSSDKLGPYVAFPQVAEGGEVWSRSIVRAPDGACKILVRARRWKGSDVFAFTALPRCVDESQLAHDTRRLDGIPKGAFRLRLRLVDKIAAAEASVVRVVFHDQDGSAIESDYAGLSHSARFTNYFYASASVEGSDTTVELVPPAGSSSISLFLHAWKGSDALGFAAEPVVMRALHENLDEDEWIAIVGDVTIPVELGEDPAGLDGKAQVVRLRTWSDRPAGEIVGHFHVEFPDLVEASPSELFALSGTDGAQEESLHVIIPPRGSSRAVLRFRSREQKALAVSRRLMAQAIGFVDAGNTVSWPGNTQFEIRSPVSQAWHSVTELRLLRPVGGALPELAILFGDAHKKTIATDLTPTGEFGALRKAASATYLTPKRVPIGTSGVELLTWSVRLLPPVNSHELIARVTPGSDGSAAAVLWDSDPFCRLEHAAIKPELFKHLAQIEQASRQAALEVIDELLALYPKDPEGLSACIDSCRRLGAVDRLRRILPLAASISGAAYARLRLKARLAASTIEELDTNYLPVAGQVVHGHRQTAESGLEGLRVAHLFKTTVPYENTGGAIRCRNIVRYQKRIGFEPLVITPLGYPHAGTTGNAWESEVVDGIPYFHLNPISREDLRDVPVTKQLDFTTLLTTRLLQQHPVDVIQASSGFRGYEQALVGLAAARALDIPFVYEVRSYHEHAWRGITDWLLDAELTKLRFAQEDRCMREADAVVTICETMKQGLIERGIDAAKIFVVPNSVDPDAFAQKPPDPDFKASLGLNQSITVGYISNVSGREGHRVLLRAVAKVRANGEPVDCLIVGDGSELDGLRQLAAELGIADYVVFTGEVPHDSVSKYYNAIDIFVVPRIADFASDYVTPMKPFEAMALRRPLVVSDRPALLEIVGADGQRGAIFRAGDHDDLARCIAELARSPGRRDALARMGGGWIDGSRRWDATIQIYKNAYAYAKGAAAIRRGDGGARGT